MRFTFLVLIEGCDPVTGRAYARPSICYISIDRIGPGCYSKCYTSPDCELLFSLSFAIDVRESKCPVSLGIHSFPVSVRELADEIKKNLCTSKSVWEAY